MASRLQPIYDIAEICALKGVTEAVLCPGSRCAPLTVSFVRHQKINTRTFSDERSAAFIANGIAQSKSKVVAMICTSGSAAYNFAPAVAEAYFQRIPILILTADRPKEWIDQLDGQTIRQQNIYGNHVKKSFELPDQYDHPDSVWHIHRTINEAINLCNQFPKGPVHVNIPLREPLYLSEDETFQYSDDLKINNKLTADSQLDEDSLKQLAEQFVSFNKILIVAGQQKINFELSAAIEKFSTDHRVPVLADIISNQHHLKEFVNHSDVFLGACKVDIKKSLRPELLITFGQSVISKNLKTFLRQYKPKNHWHIQPDGEAADTFQSLTAILPVSPIKLFQQLGSEQLKSGFEAQKRDNFYRLWEAEEHRTIRTIKSFFKTAQLNEFSLVNEIINHLPEECNLHLANSMPVRYANFIGLLTEKKGIEIFSNRGTSGIDGCVSTAVGHALATDKPNVLITGDMAFFYDRNAFWHNYKLPNLRVVVLNNHGGAIFSMIDGPSKQPEANDYFITNQKLTAKSLTQEFDFDYLKLDSLKKLKNLLKDFFDFDGRTKILEIEYNAEEVKKVMQEFKNQIRSNYDN
ncbi:MAG TPA: 2-succinyl-5-enolpyruvyl-6-hydroxy-3-cyclohexene-1-carboxylic-acid synthase [Cyclobacteriaceae bacterium]